MCEGDKTCTKLFFAGIDSQVGEGGAWRYR
jgi:hypothetical protein